MMQHSPKNAQKYVIGNWKLNPATRQDTLVLARALIDKHAERVCIGCTPSFVHLDGVIDTLKDSAVLVGSQDVSAFGQGAFTGDVSALQVADLGASFAIIGHSERRQYHQESDEILSKKIGNAFDAGLSVVFCVGETKDDYERGDTQKVIKKQLNLLSAFVQDVSAPKNPAKTTSLAKLIIAYEPVWAIGTGLTPTADEIDLTHKFIGEMLATLGIFAPILYGGSVNEKNASDIAGIARVDGVLVGGASLKVDSFATIVSAFANIHK